MGRARRRMPHIFLNTVLDTKRKTLKQNEKKKRVRRKKKAQQDRCYSMDYRRETIDSWLSDDFLVKEDTRNGGTQKEKEDQGGQKQYRLTLT